MELMACADLVGGSTDQSYFFPWSYFIVSVIWNISDFSASYFSRVTAIFVVDGCQFGPSWIFWLKMGIMACAFLVGGIMEQNRRFPDLICEYQWYETLLNCLHHISALSQPFLLLIAANLDLAGYWAENVAYGLCQLGWWYNEAKLFFHDLIW